MKVELIITFSLIPFLFVQIVVSGSKNIIGIDLGTTFVSVGIFRNGMVEIIPNEFGNRMTPAFVLFTETGDRLIGELARLKTDYAPKNTIYNIKRLIGRTWNDKFVQSHIDTVPYEVFNIYNKPHVRVTLLNGTMQFSPEQITAMFLASMKQLAEQYIDGPITDAVITTPAYFNEAQRQATKDAGAIAGLNVRRILSEPTAASMAFSTDSTEVEQMVFVLDLGGGTVDASIIQYNAGFYKPIATVGNTDLGGEDFNERIYSEVIRQYQRTNWKKFPGWRVKRKVLLEIEKAKRELSFLSETIIEINSIYPGEDFSWKLTREHFDFICSDLFLSIIALIKRALKFAEMEAKDITHIVLVGGSSKMVLVKSLISNYFGKSPNSDINPDEAIVYGAAVQAGFLSGDTETNDMLLHDIYPMTLGIKIGGGEMAAIIKRNTPIPYHNKRVFTTAEDYQKAVEIKIYRGEGSLTIDNEFIGGFKVDEIPRRLKGEPQIEVTFELDVDGILTVTATVFSYSWYMEGVPHSMVFKDGVNKLTSREIYIQRQIIENYLKKDEKNREKSNIIEEFEKLIYTFDHVVQKKIKWLDQFSSSATNAELMEQLLDLQKSIQHIANIKHNIKNKKSSNINAKDIDIREELEKHVYTMRYIIQTNMDWFEINQHATWPELIFHKNIIDTFAKETVDSISLTELLIWREERNLNDRFEL